MGAATRTGAAGGTVGRAATTRASWVGRAGHASWRPRTGARGDRNESRRPSRLQEHSLEVRVWKHHRDPLGDRVRARRGRISSPRDLRRLPPVLHRQAEADGQGRTRGALPPALHQEGRGRSRARGRDGREVLGPLLTRRRFLQAGAATAAAALAGGVYATRIELHWLEIVRRPLPVAGLPAALAGRGLLQNNRLYNSPPVSDPEPARPVERGTGLAAHPAGFTRQLRPWDSAAVLQHTESF